MKIPHTPDYKVHPGETLVETLDELGMSREELSERAQLPLETIKQIMWGKSSITEEIATKLESVLGVPASFWLRAQVNFNTNIK